MGLILDGCATSEAIDSSGEVLELKGLDISDFTSGKATLDTEHRGEDAAGYSWLDVIGRVISAKKIYKREDCETERQRKYWDEIRLPYLYVKCELFDDEADGDHASAKAVAATIRHYNRRGLPIVVRFSIEGSTLSMEDKVIKAAIARKLALTVRPANKTCNFGILEDDWDKSHKKSKKEGSYEGGPGGVLEESSEPFTKFERPDAVKLGRSVLMAWDPEVDEGTEELRDAARRVVALAKALEKAEEGFDPSCPSGVCDVGQAPPVEDEDWVHPEKLEGLPADKLWHILYAHTGSDMKSFVTKKRGYTMVPSYRTMFTSPEEAQAHANEVADRHGMPRTSYSVHPGKGERFNKNEGEWLENLKKALEGGQMGGAPSTLVGGAALQREDLGEHKKRLVATFKAALRDHDPATHGPFRAYLKSLLPEACSEFLDRFAELADEIPVKAKLAMLQKTSPQVQIKPEHQAAPNKPERRSSNSKSDIVRPREEREAAFQETVARIKEARKMAFPPGTEDEAGVVPPSETGPYKRVKGKPEQKYASVEVDPKRGILYIGGTSEGATQQKPPQAWKLYAPTDSKYMEMLAAPENNAHHDRAMDNWVTVHRLLRQGALPSKLIAHTAMYTLMAPNEGGPIQDLAYALFQDLVNKGFDPTKQYNEDELSDWEREFGDMAAGQYLPEYMRDHFLSDASNIWRAPSIREKQTGTVRLGLDTVSPLSNFGENPRLRSTVGKLSLGDKQQAGKWNTVARYHATHTFLDRLVREHGVDANKVMEEFLSQKKADPKFGYGFGIKTARYTGGMMGMGQHVVPDTHFIRHLFGLHPDDPRVGDAKAIFAGDSPTREIALQGIDQWFRKNHPAFAWTRQKLLKRYGEDFGEHATFPAFWHHWTLIPMHDRARQWPAGMAGNEGTDHEVFWNSARHILNEYGLPSDPHDPRLRKAEAWKEGGSLPARTVHAMKSMEDRYGPVAASLFFYRFLAPLLIAADKPAALYKAELLARLAKGEFSEDKPVPKVVVHKGAAIEPGEIQWTAGPRAGQSIPLVSIGKDWHHVLGEDGSLMRMQAGHPNSRIIKEPKLVRAKTAVDSKRHGHPTLHGSDAQHDLIHGIDMAKRLGKPGIGVVGNKYDSHDVTGWYQSHEGHLAFVKPNSGPGWDEREDDVSRDKFGPAHREVAFQRLADEFFGLGEHVPTTTVFKHPVSGEWMSAQKKVEGEHYSPTSMFHKESLGQMARTGQLDKLALMDMILGHGDRHTQNGLISPDGRMLHLIDNGLAFPQHVSNPYYADIPAVSEYWKAGNMYNDGKQWYTKPLHQAAAAWLESLDPQKLAQHMDRLGVPKSERDEAVRRLIKVKYRQQRQGRPLSRGAAFHAPFLAEPATAQDKARVEFESGLTEPVNG